jgi:hypothetical protein
MAVRAVLAGGFLLLLAAVVFLLSQSKPRQAGSNHVPEVAEVVKRGGSWQRCQDGETVPKDAARLRLLVGTYGRPTPELRVVARGPDRERVTSGSLPPGGHEGHVEIPVRRVGETQTDVRVCVSVSGSGRTMLYGAGEGLRLEWLRAGSESWFSLVPTVSHRFGLGKANPFGSWLLALGGLVLVAVSVATARLVLRELA